MNALPLTPLTHSKVYITNEVAGLNFDKARQFGGLIPLTRGSVDVFHPERVKKAVEEGLRGFDACKDYLLVSGAALTAAFALAHLSLWADDGRLEDAVLIKFLMFDSKRQDYFVRTVAI